VNGPTAALAGVGVGVLVGVGVRVLVTVGVGVFVFVTVGVNVTVGVTDGDNPGVGVKVGVAVGVGEALGVQSHFISDKVTDPDPEITLVLIAHMVPVWKVGTGNKIVTPWQLT